MPLSKCRWSRLSSSDVQIFAASIKPLKKRDNSTLDGSQMKCCLITDTCMKATFFQKLTQFKLYYET